MEHLKKERLKNVMGRGWISKNMEGDLSCIINPKEEYRGPDGARRAIGDALGILQSIRDVGNEFYDTVNSEDLRDIITFLSNKYWYLNRVKEELESTISPENVAKCQKIIDDAYRSYDSCFMSGVYYKYQNQKWLKKEEFINEIKTNPEFSKEWGLSIEDKLLSWQERRDLLTDDQRRGLVPDKNNIMQGDFGDISPFTDKVIHFWLSCHDIPTKLVTITHGEENLKFYSN